MAGYARVKPAHDLLAARRAVWLCSTGSPGCRFAPSGLHLFLRRRSCAGGKPTTREEKGHAQAAARSIVMACVARDFGDGSAVFLRCPAGAKVPPPPPTVAARKRAARQTERSP